MMNRIIFVGFTLSKISNINWEKELPNFLWIEKENIFWSDLCWINNDDEAFVLVAVTIVCHSLLQPMVLLLPFYKHRRMWGRLLYLNLWLQPQDPLWCRIMCEDERQEVTWRACGENRDLPSLHWAAFRGMSRWGEVWHDNVGLLL